MDTPRYVHTGPGRNDYATILGHIEHKHGYSAVRSYFNRIMHKQEKNSAEQAAKK